MAAVAAMSAVPDAPFHNSRTFGPDPTSCVRGVRLVTILGADRGAIESPSFRMHPGSRCFQRPKQLDCAHLPQTQERSDL